MLKVKLSFGTILLILSVLAISCDSSVAQEVVANDEREQTTPGEHMDGDEHSIDEHMADDEHVEDEHIDGDEHSVDEHMADDEHIEDAHMDGDEHSADEHMADGAHAHFEVPHEYEDLENPLSYNDDVVQAGSESYASYCVACHGTEGRGDGPAAASLDPGPADLTDGMMMQALSDAYLYWRITKGGVGEPFNSAMPAWDEALTEEQVWQLVMFLRTLPEERGRH